MEAQAPGAGLIDAISDSVKLIGNWNSLPILQDEIISSTGEIPGSVGFFGSGFTLDFQPQPPHQHQQNYAIIGNGENNSNSSSSSVAAPAITLSSSSSPFAVPLLPGESSAADLVYTDLTYVNLNNGGGTSGRKEDNHNHHQSIIRVVPAAPVPVTFATTDNHHEGALNKIVNLNSINSSFSSSSNSISNIITTVASSASSLRIPVVPVTTTTVGILPSISSSSNTNALINNGITIGGSSNAAVDHHANFEDLDHRCPSPSFSETFSFLSDCSESGLLSSMKNSSNIANSHGGGVGESNNNNSNHNSGNGGANDYVKTWISSELAPTNSQPQQLCSVPTVNFIQSQQQLQLPPPLSQLLPPPPPPSAVKTEYNSLSSVVATASSSSTLKCASCSKIFDNPLTLQIHMRLHTGERPYKCKCGEAFIHYTYLDYHMSNTHGIPNASSHTDNSNNDQKNIDGTLLQKNQKSRQKKKKSDKKELTTIANGTLQSLLSESSNSNNDVKPYKCQFCEKSFKHSSWLIMHTRTHTGEKPFKCHHCSLAYTQRGSLAKHLLTHGEDPSAISAITAAMVPTTSSVMQPPPPPIPTNSIQAVAVQPQVGSVGVTSSNNLTLRRIQKKKKKGSGDGTNSAKSGKTKLYNSNLRTDSVGNKEIDTDINQNENGKRPVKCTICRAQFSQRKALVIHMKNHAITGKPFPCSHCSKSFRQSTRLQKHLRDAHGNIENGTDSTDPSQTADSQSDTVVSAPDYEKFNIRVCAVPLKRCDLSGAPQNKKSKGVLKPGRKKKGSMGTKIKGGKNPHVYANKPADFHASEKGHQCSICNKVLLTTTNLTVHMRIHTGEKPYQCSHCSKSFSVQSNLKAHVRTHTGEKPYQCSLCNTGFATRGNFTSHLRAHGVHPYKCSLCDEQFTFSWKLKNHMMTAHNKKMKAEHKVLLT